MMLRSSSTPFLGSLLSSFSDSPNNNCHLLSDFQHKSTSKISCNIHSSPSPTPPPFRRVQSEGNLGELADVKHPPPRLEAIPSFSNNTYSEDQTTPDPDRFECESKVGARMYLAAGLGVSEGGGIKMEEHYRKMVEGDPGNGMVLRNYGEYLERVKGDLEGAEEYYSRAILADPKDGEILSRYAKLIWELHRDEDRATHYFERAIQASAGEDSHIQAAYASFLWDAEEEEEEESSVAAAPLVFRHESIAGF